MLKRLMRLSVSRPWWLWLSALPCERGPAGPADPGRRP
jgi:hypothetical protein